MCEKISDLDIIVCFRKCPGGAEISECFPKIFLVDVERFHVNIFFVRLNSTAKPLIGANN